MAAGLNFLIVIRRILNLENFISKKLIVIDKLNNEQRHPDDHVKVIIVDPKSP